MTITAIEEYPKGKGRVAVYLNNEFAFVLYKGELSKYGIIENEKLSIDAYNRVLNEVLIPRAKKRGMNLLKTIDRTQSDVTRKLKEGGYPEEAVDAAVEYLKSFHYIDDYRYAEEYYRFKRTSYSKKMIEAKLIEKGISRQIIDEAIGGYEEENDIDSESAEEALIRKMILKRCPQGVTDQSYEDRQRLFAYLYNKGFSVAAIERVYSSLGLHF